MDPSHEIKLVARTLVLFSFEGGGGGGCSASTLSPYLPSSNYEKEDLIAGCYYCVV